MYLQRNGNVNNIHERNCATAMVVGTTRNSVLLVELKRFTDRLLTHKVPTRPFPVNYAGLQRGRMIRKAQCSPRHDFGKINAGQVTTTLTELGNNPYRVNSRTIGLMNCFHQFKTPQINFDTYGKTYRYNSSATDGIWVRSLHLYNGSVPSVCETAAETRTVSGNLLLPQ